jgi:hypothetical protein
MVEIFCKRGEIMPNDESVEQHKQKRAEEIADVDRDKNSPQGLFKGTFRFEDLAAPLFDDADGIFRCPHCQHEHVGGPLCANCGTRFAEHYDDDEDDPYGYGFSDIDDDIDADLELADLEFDMDQEAHDHHRFHHFRGSLPHFHYSLGTGPHGRFLIHHHHHHHDESVEGYSGNDSSGGSEEEEEGDEGSLEDFVVRDEELQNESNRNRRPIITISDDDESDEDGPVPPVRRHRNRRQAVPSSSPLSQSIHSITDSENGETNVNADILRDAGWSPLDTENEDDDEPIRCAYHGYPTTDDEQNSDAESDTNTMRNDPSDTEDDHYRYMAHATPSDVDDGCPIYGGRTPTTYDENSEMEFPHSMDRDGDTEMSASPGPSTSSRSVSVSTNCSGSDEHRESQIYGYDDDDEEGGTPRGPHGYSGVGEHLGVANEIHDLDDDDSSDVSIQPPPRRRPRQPRSARVQQTDPRISMMFADYQMNLRGQIQRSGLNEFEVEVRSSDQATRNRRMTSYRLQPSRRVETLRNSRSPSATRIISSSNRVSRPPRQYQRRYVETILDRYGL